MAYDLKLADRIRSELSGVQVMEKKMFGGLGFLLNGNMACGVNKDNLIMRVDPEKHDRVLKKPHAIPFDLIQFRVTDPTSRHAQQDFASTESRFV